MTTYETTNDRDQRRERLLTEIFGSGEGADPLARARQSSQIFVRGLDLLTLDTSDRATGRRLTAVEAYRAYGISKLQEAVREGSAIISATPDAAGRVLRERREQLGITKRVVAARSGLQERIIDALEESRRRPVREYERAARVLGLDERQLSFQAMPKGNENVAVRLRTLADERPSLDSSSVISLAEASWVAMTQIRLEEELGLREGGAENALARWQSESPGDYTFPPYRVGYAHADELRREFDLGDSPIPSMRAFVEKRLGIPVVQTDLHSSIAGATVESAGRRAIVLNINGQNRNPFVLRSTLAHEVGHLLFDRPDLLQELRVDNYDELERRPDAINDFVEQRANAFGIQLLAPQGAAVEQYLRRRELNIDVLDVFGVSFTAGRYQVWNGMDRKEPLDTIGQYSPHIEADWEARERYTVDYHPIRQLAAAPSRAGRFSAVVVRSAGEGIVSWDTAAEWLLCEPGDVQSSADAVAELFDDVFR